MMETIVPFLTFIGGSILVGGVAIVLVVKFAEWVL